MQRFLVSDEKARRGGGIRPGLVAASLVALMMLGNCSAFRNSESGGYPQGKAALRSGDYAAAQRIFESAVRASDDEESRVGLLRTLRETGRYQDAEKRAREFLAGQGNSAALQLELALALKETGRYSDSEQSLRRAAALAATQAMRLRTSRELADLLGRTGRRKEAAALWDRILDEYKAGKISGSGPLGDAAVAAWRRGYAQDAKDIFMDATDGKHGEISIESLSDFGYLFLEKYNATAAIEVFRDCLKINKSYAPALLGIALAKKYEGAHEVEAYARAALQVNPNMTGALNALAELAIGEEDYAKALEQINVALAVNPAEADSLSLQAFCLYIRGDRQGFAAIEKRVLEINPSFGRFYHVLAENLVSRGKYQEAADLSRKAVELDPELWGAFLTLGMNLTRVGDLTEGRKAIQQAFNGDPFNIWAFNYLKLFDQVDGFVRTGSEHFRFLTSKEDSPVLPAYAAQLAEEAYAKLTTRYGFKPKGPLQIEIYPDHGGFAVRTQGLNGLQGALGVCFGKVVAIDSPRAREASSFNWGSTLWHELVHVMTLQMTNHNIPRWFTEGLSVYEERRAQPGWGDPLTPSFLVAYKTGKLKKVSQLNQGFVRPTSPEDIAFAYYQSGLVCEMIEERFGFEKIRQSLLLFAENVPAEEVFFRTLGWSPAQMDAEYAKYLDTRFGVTASRVSTAERGEGSQTADSLRKRLQNDPEDWAANLQLGALLRKNGSNDDAEKHLRKAQQLFPQYVGKGNPYEILGTIYLEMKRDDDALAQFQAWRRLDDSSVAPLLLSAEIFSARKDWNSAANMLSLSIFINPYDVGVHRRLAEAAMEAGQWQLAVTAYRTLAGLDRTDPAAAHYGLARALLAAGNRQEARREVLRSLEIAPRFPEAQKLLLKLREERNEN